MGRYAGARDTGSTTGVATMILALLSAGTVASITLVGVHQLAPAISERLNAGGPSSVRAPAGVVVTPRAAPATPQGHPSKPRTPAPSDVTVAAARGTSATTQRGVTQAVAAVVKVPLPAVAARRSSRPPGGDPSLAEHPARDALPPARQRIPPRVRVTPWRRLSVAPRHVRRLWRPDRSVAPWERRVWRARRSQPPREL